MSEAPNTRYFMFDVRVSDGSRLTGHIPYSINIEQTGYFARMMSDAIGEEVRKAGKGDCTLEDGRWITVDSLDDVDSTSRYMRGLPPLEWNDGPIRL